MGFAPAVGCSGQEAKGIPYQYSWGSLPSIARMFDRTQSGHWYLTPPALASTSNDQPAGRLSAGASAVLPHRLQVRVTVSTTD